MWSRREVSALCGCWPRSRSDARKCLRRMLARGAEKQAYESRRSSEGEQRAEKKQSRLECGAARPRCRRFCGRALREIRRVESDDLHADARAEEREGPQSRSGEAKIAA